VKSKSEGMLAAVLDSSFPSSLNVSLCHSAEVSAERVKQKAADGWCCA